MNYIDILRALRKFIITNKYSDVDTLTTRYPYIVNYLPPKYFHTTLMISLINDHTPDKKITQLLIDRGCDINYMSKFFTSDADLLKTPLTIEALYGNTSNFSFLLKNGADIYIRDHTGKTVLEQVIEKSTENPDKYRQIIKILRKKQKRDYIKLQKILYIQHPRMNNDCVKHISEFIY